MMEAGDYLTGFGSMGEVCLYLSSMTFKTTTMKTFVLLFLALTAGAFPAIAGFDTISIHQDLKIIKLSEHSFIHVSYIETENWGAFTSNGFIFVDDGEALLIDTPMQPPLTRYLVEWIKNELRAELVAFVPNHWHDDCMGGFEYLDSLGVPSYAHHLTCEIRKNANLPAPETPFYDSLTLDIGGKKAVCRYLGPAHTKDNIVVWMPCENILFAGCMVKDIQAKNMGNTADGDLEQWPTTLERVLEKYGNAKYIIPGHGSIGNAAMIKHTLSLLQN